MGAQGCWDNGERQESRKAWLCRHKVCLFGQCQEFVSSGRPCPLPLSLHLLPLTVVLASTQTSLPSCCCLPFDQPRVFSTGKEGRDQHLTPTHGASFRPFSVSQLSRVLTVARTRVLCFFLGSKRAATWSAS